MPERKIKVVHCIEQVYSGGVEQRRLQLARLLPAERYQQAIICTVARGPLVEEIRRYGVQVFEVGPVRSVFDVGRYRKAMAVMRRIRPDIVHGAVFEGVTTAVVAGRMTRAPLILVEETSHPVNRSWRGRSLFRGLSAAADGCIAVSPAVGDYLRDVAKVHPSKIRVITNGVGAPRKAASEEIEAKRRELGIETTDFVLGSVGRMVDDTEKRFQDLIAAVAMLRRRRLNLKLVLVGDGPERQRLEKLAEERKVADRVRFTGYQHDVGVMYGIMDAFALVSAREAFGLVVPEAMFCGLPVIATSIGGLKQIVRHDETGYLVPVAAPGAISEAIERFASSSVMRARMGEAGRRRAAEHYSADRYVREVDEFYGYMLRSGTNRSDRFGRRARPQDGAKKCEGQVGGP